MPSNKNILNWKQRLEIDGYEKTNPYGGLRWRFIEGVDSRIQFQNFCRRVFETIGEFNLPIYRMADGEFIFLVGRRPAIVSMRGTKKVSRIIDNMKFWIDKSRAKKGFKTCWGEIYEGKDLEYARNIVSKSISEISKRGILAIYFALRKDCWSEQYFKPMCDWFDNNMINIASDNYVPFYFVYALLSGETKRELFEKRRILVVTHFDENKRTQIAESLLGQGAASVDFINISATRAVFERINTQTIPTNIEIALVAAGVGSANIITQLKMINGPVIDSGIALECYSNPSLRGTRPFLMDGV